MKVSSHPRERDIHEVCHDLRQPAAAILALVSAAGAEPDTPPPVLRRLQQIAAEARHISTIIGHAAGEAMSFRPLDAADSTARLVESFRLSSNATITVVAESGILVVADDASLRRGLGNLLDNALRAAGPSGSVLVGVSADQGWVSFDVHDSGPGFGSGPVGLSGLGLGIVERFAGSHGGDLSIHASPLGGTLARLRLPAARARGFDPTRRRQ